MNRDEMVRLFEAHRDAEAARDLAGILATFTEDCCFETVPLGLRRVGHAATRAAYESFFTAFSDITPDDEGIALGEDAIVVWGHLRGRNTGEWLGVAPGGGSFAVPLAKVAPFKDGRMAGESIYVDLATLCEQARLDLGDIREAAKAAGAPATHPAERRERPAEITTSPAPRLGARIRRRFIEPPAGRRLSRRSGGRPAAGPARRG